MCCIKIQIILSIIISRNCRAFKVNLDNDSDNETETESHSRVCMREMSDAMQLRDTLKA